MARLVIEELGERNEYPLTGDAITIGRDLSSEVVICDSMSSRRHCRVSRENERFFVEDLRSSNGTSVNGTMVHGADHSPVPLRDGDQIRIGEVRITFLSETGVPAAGGETSSSRADQTASDGRHGAGPRERRVVLHVVDGPQSGIQLPIRSLPFTIGRRHGNDLVLQDVRVSGLHAEVVEAGDRLVLRDCDSGNGIVVAGRRVRERVLGSGERLVLGSTAIEFSGLPRTPEAELPTATVAPPQGAREPSAVGAFAAEESRRVDIAREVTAASPWQALFTTVFFVSFLAILYFGYTSVQDYVAHKNPPVAAGNLVPANPSFEQWNEDGSPVGWRVASDSDRATLEPIIGAEQGVSHGRRALAVRGGSAAGRGFVRVESSEAIELVDPGPLELRGKLRNEGFRLAGLQLRWFVRTGEGAVFVAESFAPMVPPRGSFTHIEATLEPPAGLDVDLCSVGVIALGRGALAVDHLSVTRSSAEKQTPVRLEVPSRIDPSRTLGLSFGATGAFSVVRGRGVLARNVRLAEPQPGEVPYGQLVCVTAAAPTVDDSGVVSCSYAFLGSAREARVFYQLAQRMGDSAQVTYQDTSGDEDQPLALVVELDDRATELPQALFSAGRRVAQGAGTADLAGTSGDEWIIGDRSRQTILSFSCPVELEMLSAKQSRGVPTVLLHARGPRHGGVLDLYLTTVSAREEERIAGRWQEVERLVEEDLFGEVLTVLGNLQSEFSWRPDIKRRAEAMRESILRRGERRLANLRGVLADLREYRTEPVRVLFERRCEELMRAYRGTDISNTAQSLREEVAARETMRSEQFSAQEATRLLTRAEEFFTGHRDGFARMYAERVLQSAAGGGEVARRARSLLDRIEARN